MKKIALLLIILSLTSCNKYGFVGRIYHALGNWAEVSLPEGCIAKQIAVENSATGVAVLCEDGRIFH